MKDATWSSLRAIGRLPLERIETKRRFGALIREARADGASWESIAFAARKCRSTVQKYSRLT